MKFPFLKKKKPDQGETLRMLEHRMIAIELAGEGIGIAETDGRISFVNKAFARMYGYNSWQDLVGKSWLDLTAEDERETIRNVVGKALRTHRTWSGPGVGRRRNGDEFKKYLSISGLPDGRWIFLVRDISEQAKLEEIANRRLAAMEAAGDGIGLVDPEGRLIYMNRALKNLHEFDDSDERNYIGHSWAYLYTDAGQAQIRDIVMPELRRSGYWKGESPMLTKSGRVVYAEMSMTLLEDGGLIGTARDVTERVHAKMEHEKLERQFFQAQKMEAIGHLAGGIAHDFNNLLASMMGYADFLMEDTAPESRQHHFAKSIYEGGEQARKVIDRLLMFSKAQDLDFDAVDMGRIARVMVDLLRSSVSSTIHINLAADDSDHCTIIGNDTLISQALMNLCVNARDAIGDTHGHIDINIKRIDHARPPGKDGILCGYIKKGAPYIRVSVRDSGHGIAPHVMTQIFDPFFTTKPRDQGTGLGLATVHGIMEVHKGAIFVRSWKDNGSEFNLFFPAEESDVSEDTVNESRRIESANIKGRRVIIVDDQTGVRDMMGVMMERMGCHVTLCADGPSCIKAVQAGSGDFDLIITDHSMPNMTGFELAQAIAGDYPDIPVILSSGFSEESLAERMHDLSTIKAVIRKPIDYNRLRQVINQSMRDRPVAAAAFQTAQPLKPPAQHGQNQQC